MTQTTSSDRTCPRQNNATCITASCARGNFGAVGGASSGADMYPAFDAAIYMPRARMVFEDQVQISPACSVACVAYRMPDPVSRLLRQTAPCPLVLRRSRDRWSVYQPHVMPNLLNLAAPEMGATTGFHRDNAGRQIAEECQDLISSQLLAQNGASAAVSRVNLKHILRQIEPDRDNLRYDRSPLWIVANPPWHTDAVGGGGHSISPRFTDEQPTRVSPYQLTASNRPRQGRTHARF